MSGPDRNELPDVGPSSGSGAGSGMFQVISLGGSVNEQQTREYKRRRSHKKSRGGCQGCKQRRVKCDQATPACLRCKRNQRQCVYPDEGGGPSSSGSQMGGTNKDGRSARPSLSRNTTVPIKKEFEETSSVYNTQTRSSSTLVPIYNNSPPDPIFLRPKPMPTDLEYGTPSGQLMFHFNAAGEGIFDMPNFMGPLIPLALQFPHLRGTILAAAASHLSHKAPGLKDYHIAKHYQQAIALKAYQVALITPFKSQGQLGVDVLLVTAMLMNMLSFIMPLEAGDLYATWDSRQPGPPPPCADPDPDPRRSWVFSSQESRLSWLALQMGLTPLLIATAPWREKSRLRLLFANSDDERRTLSGSWQSLSRVPPMWLKLFSLDPKSKINPSFRGSGVVTPAPITSGGSTGTGSGNSPSTAGSSPDSSTTATETISEADRIYRAPLRVVAELRLMEANDRNLLQYFQFIGQLSHDFRHKLLERDEKALWLFGMWMGLLCRFPSVWWTRRRTRCDFRAIRLWLHLVGVGQRAGEEGDMWRTLLQDLDDTWGYNFETDPIMHRALSYNFG